MSKTYKLKDIVTNEDAIDTLEDLWNLYALEEDNKMTKGAIKLKNDLRRIVLSGFITKIEERINELTKSETNTMNDLEYGAYGALLWTLGLLEGKEK